MDFEKEKQGEGGYGSRHLSLSFLARFYMSVTRMWTIHDQTEQKRQSYDDPALDVR